MRDLPKNKHCSYMHLLLSTQLAQYSEKLMRWREETPENNKPLSKIMFKVWKNSGCCIKMYSGKLVEELTKLLSGEGAIWPGYCYIKQPINQSYIGRYVMICRTIIME